MRRLIVNADDFGISPSVNEAVIRCYRKGNLTSATLMANMPAAEDAAKLARENPGLSVGLHFCLTEGRPLSDCPTLVDRRGVFLDRPRLLLKILRGQVEQGEVVREFLAQLGRLRALGIAVSHVDSHQHVHMSPWLFKRILPVINDDRIPLRLVYPPIDVSLAFKRPVKFLKQLMLNWNSRRYIKALKTKSNDCLVSIHDLDGGQPVALSAYQGLLDGAGHRQIVEVMVHPYILGDDVFALYPEDLEGRLGFLRKCDREYQLLSREEPFVRPAGFELTSYERI